MTTQTKDRNGGNRPTLNTTDNCNFTASERLAGWFSLAESNRIDRQRKRRWRKGVRR